MSPDGSRVSRKEGSEYDYRPISASLELFSKHGERPAFVDHVKKLDTTLTIEVKRLEIMDV